MILQFCNLFVDHERKTTVETHLFTKNNENKIQIFITTVQPNFAEKLVAAFLSADIALHKLINKELKALFEFIGHWLIPESSSHVYMLNTFKHNFMDYPQAFFKDSKICMFNDESKKNGKKNLIL